MATEVSTGILKTLEDASKCDSALASKLSVLLGLSQAPLPKTSAPTNLKTPPPTATARKTVSKAAPPPVARKKPASTSVPATSSSSSSPVAAVLKDVEAAQFSMRVVNTALKTLSALVQTSWKPPAPLTSSARKIQQRTSVPSLANVLVVVEASQTALGKLRAMIGTVSIKEQDIEKASVSILAKCVALDLQEVSLQILHLSRPFLCSLYTLLPIPPIESIPLEKVEPPTPTSPPRPAIKSRSRTPAVTSTTTTSTSRRSASAASSSTRTTSTATSSKALTLSSVISSSSQLESRHVQLLCLPHLATEIKTQGSAVASIVASWSVSAMITVLRAECESDSALNNLLAILSKPESVLSQLPTLLDMLPSPASIPPLLLPLIKCIPLLPLPSTIPSATVLPLRTEGFLLLLRLSIKPTMFWSEVNKGVRAARGVTKEVLKVTLKKIKENLSLREDEKTFWECLDWNVLVDVWLTTCCTTEGSSAKDVESVEDYLPLSSTLQTLSSDSASCCFTFMSQHHKTIERIRKLSIKLLEPLQKSSSEPEMKKYLETTLNSLVKISQKTIHHSIDTLSPSSPSLLPTSESSSIPLADIAATTLDSLLFLAKSTFVPKQHHTYTPTFKLLSDSLAILQSFANNYDAVFPIPNYPKEADLSNWAKCISGVAYNCGGTLYQIDFAGDAVRFAKLSCEVWHSYPSLKEAVKEGQEDQISRRWEFLSACQLKIGDRRAAFASLVEAFKAISSKTLSQIHAQSSNMPFTEIFSASTSFGTYVSGLVSKIISIGIFDLFMEPEELSLDRLLAGHVGEGISPEVTGCFAELQIKVLESMLSNSTARKLSDQLGSLALSIYTPSAFPVRRMRLLMRQIESQCSSAEVESERLLSDVEELSLSYSLEGLSIGTKAASNLKKDVNLAPYMSQYLGQALIWAAILRHRTSMENPDVSIRSQLIKFAQDAISNLSKSSKTMGTLDDLDKLYRDVDCLSNLMGILGYPIIRMELLKLSRRLTIGQPKRIDDHVSSSISLAQEYLDIGKHSCAQVVLQQIESEISKSGDHLSEEVTVKLYLVQAQALVSFGNGKEDLERGVSKYLEARDIAKTITETSQLSTKARIRERSLKLERSAQALMVYASIQAAHNDLPQVVACLSQAHRLWSRALESLSRLNPSLNQPSKAAASAGSLFQSTRDKSDRTPADDQKPSTNKTKVFGVSTGGLHWRLAKGLLDCLFDLARFSFQRGTSRDTEYFLCQAGELALSVESQVLSLRAEVRKTVMKVQLRRPEAVSDIERLSAGARDQLASIKTRELVELQTLQGDVLVQDEPESAVEVYAVALATLNEIGKQFLSLGEKPVLSKKLLASSHANKSQQDQTVFPALVGYLLRQSALLVLRAETYDEEMFQELDARLRNLPLAAGDDVDYRASIALQMALKQFKSDLALSSLTESTISMPMGTSTGGKTTVPKSRKEMISTFSKAESMFIESLGVSGASGAVQRVRRACMALSMLRAFQTSLGPNSQVDTVAIAGRLDVSSVITLRRELLEVISHKYIDPRHDDLLWPEFPLQPTSEDANDEDEHNVMNMRRYWNAVHQRHRTTLCDGPSAEDLSILPDNWSVITINVTSDLNTMFISRYRQGREPLIFCLPLDRQGRREGEDEHFTFQNAIDELNHIIKESDEGAKNAKHVENKEDRVEWWTKRRELDKRLEQLLANIEFCWLGAFKTILNEPTGRSAESFSWLRNTFESIFKRNLQDRQKAPRVRIDDGLLEAFSTLPPNCREEELEDLVYFVLDLYQVHGVQVALAEIDIDELVTDLRTMLEEYETKRRSESLRAEDDHQVFLVLDKNVQGIPWESIPSLRGRAVSRIPSLPFLLDRVHLARQLQSHSSSKGALEDGLVSLPINPKNGFFILNPSGDLKKTEEQFTPWVNELSQAGWKGIIGREPSELEMANALGKRDLVVYFGHSGGEQYIRSNKIRNLSRCATTMLWGCSSGALKEMGELDRTGTPNNYMLAGCPSLIANLWDVTDRDIDRLSQAVFTKMHLSGAEIQGQKPTSTATTTTSSKNGLLRSKSAAPTPITTRPAVPMTSAKAVGQSRDVCKLKYLTGAATVVYGIPWKLPSPTSG